MSQVQGDRSSQGQLQKVGLDIENLIWEEWDNGILDSWNYPRILDCFSFDYPCLLLYLQFSMQGDALGLCAVLFSLYLGMHTHVQANPCQDWQFLVLCFIQF